MGTRADFYLGRRGATGPDDPMVWLGSISWDGGEIDDVAGVTTKEDYGRKLAEFLAARDDTTWAVEPWPWPWETSRTTDCAYTFDPIENKLFAVQRVNGRDYWTDYDYQPFEDHEYDCEIPPGRPVEEHAGCTGYPFPNPSEQFLVIYPDMSDRMGSTEHIMGRSGMIVATSEGIADVKTEAGPATADLGVIFIHAATGVTGQLAELPAGPGQSGYDPKAFEEAVRVREVQRAAGLSGPELSLEDVRRGAEQARTARETRPIGHHLGQLIDGEADPVNRPGMPTTFGRDVDAAVEHFLATTEPEQPDPETEAAMRAGFGDNPPAQMYATGYAAGEAAGKVVAQDALMDAIRAGEAQSLLGLRDWIDEQPEGAFGGMFTKPLIDEINRRIEAAKGRQG